MIPSHRDELPGLECVWYPDGVDPDDYDVLAAAAHADHYTPGIARAQLPDSPALRALLARIARACPGLDLRTSPRVLWPVHLGEDRSRTAISCNPDERPGPRAHVIGAPHEVLEVTWPLACAGPVQQADTHIAGSHGGRLDAMLCHLLDGDLDRCRLVASVFAGARCGGERARYTVPDTPQGRLVLAALRQCHYAERVTHQPDGGLTGHAVHRVTVHSTTFSDAAVRWALAVARAEARLAGALAPDLDEPRFAALPLGTGDTAAHMASRRQPHSKTRPQPAAAEQPHLF